jgi:hypothetical protein
MLALLFVAGRGLPLRSIILGEWDIFSTEAAKVDYTAEFHFDSVGRTLGSVWRNSNSTALDSYSNSVVGFYEINISVDSSIALFELSKTNRLFLGSLNFKQTDSGSLESTGQFSNSIAYSITLLNQTSASIQFSDFPPLFCQKHPVIQTKSPFFQFMDVRTICYGLVGLGLLRIAMIFFGGGKQTAKEPEVHGEAASRVEPEPILPEKDAAEQRQEKKAEQKPRSRRRPK